MELNEKQIQIIETAERLFAERGFDGTSVRDIADEAGVNVAMISYYFGSKEKMMEALFELRVGSVKIRVESLIKHKIMLGVVATNKNPAILKAANIVKIRNAEVVTELIKDGQKKGIFKKKIDVILMMNTMVGTVSQTMMSQTYYREFNKQQDMPDEEFQTLLKRRLSIHIKTLFKAILTNEA